VRLQFRSLLGWRILDLPLALYPRWLVAAERGTLTELCPADTADLSAAAAQRAHAA
jgi:hypothetical protein